MSSAQALKAYDPTLACRWEGHTDGRESLALATRHFVQGARIVASQTTGWPALVAEQVRPTPVPTAVPGRKRRVKGRGFLPA
jgi:hypothetical protein